MQKNPLPWRLFFHALQILKHIEFGIVGEWVCMV